MWRGNQPGSNAKKAKRPRAGVGSVSMAVSGSVGRAWFVGPTYCFPAQAGRDLSMARASGCGPCVSEACSLYREGTYGSSIYPSTNCLVEAPARQCRGSASINLANVGECSHSRAVAGLSRKRALPLGILKLSGITGITWRSRRGSRLWRVSSRSSLVYR